MSDGYEPNPSLKPDALFLEMLPHVPSRDMTSERKLQFLADGITFKGYIDFSGYAQDVLWCGDYKTSSRPWEYGLTTPAEMLKDEQVNIYSLANMLDFRGFTNRARWIYADTSKNRFAFKTDVDVSFTQAEDYMADNALPRARVMHSAAESYTALVPTKDAPHRTKLKVLNEIPCNPEECGYRTRNCGFKAHCKLFSATSLIYSEANIKETIVGEDGMAKTLAEIIAENKARKAAAGEEPAAVVEAATPAEAEALPPEHVEALESAVEQRNLPANEQDLGRKAAEKNAKEAEKAAKEEAKASKKAAKETKGEVAAASGVVDLLEALKKALGSSKVKVEIEL
jgi:hypothetical protein